MSILYRILEAYSLPVSKGRKRVFCCFFFPFKLSVVLESTNHIALETENLCCSIESGTGRSILSPAHFAEVLFSQL